MILGVASTITEIILIRGAAGYTLQVHDSGPRSCSTPTFWQYFCSMR